MLISRRGTILTGTSGGKRWRHQRRDPERAAGPEEITQFLYGEGRTAERLKNKDHPWRGGVEASNYLRGKYIGILSPKPMRANYRARFERNPANAKFLRDMESNAKPQSVE